MLSTSAKNGEMPFSPTTFIAVPRASAEASRTFGSKHTDYLTEQHSLENK